jgi:two-component system chemotaxis sensor kinase CheA
MDDELLSEFLAEAEDLIELLYADIASLRARGAEGRARRALVGRIFRHVHTIKGSASAAGLEATGGLAHEFETLLDGVRMGHRRGPERGRARRRVGRAARAGRETPPPVFI